MTKKLILKVENRYTTIKNADRMIVKLLQDVTSYLVAGSYFSPAFRDKRWDGRAKLLKFSKKRGYFFPTGLLQDVMSELDKLGLRYKVDIKNRRSPKAIERIWYAWNTKIKLRLYQEKACKAFFKSGLFEGSGILKMPIRSGKTKTVSWIINFLSVKTLFIVTSKMLLHQTKQSLENSLFEDVGLIGDGIWREKNITVAMAQTLSKLQEAGHPTKKKGKEKKKSDKDAAKRWKELTGRYDCVIFDEAHHLTAETWHKGMMDFDARYKIGLSATAYPDRSEQWEKGAIWLKACCGNIQYNIGTSKLVKLGYLVAPEIWLFKIKKPDLLDKGWSQTVLNRAIYENKHRNRTITKITKHFVKRGEPVLVVTNRLNQVAILSELFDKAGISHHTITSKDPSGERINKVGDFTSGGVKVLIGTVLSEGIDIPELVVVINAEGGKDIKPTIQKMRNLTPSDGKTKAYYIDFLDLTNRYFAKHSKERLEVYRKEEAFKIRVCRVKDL